MAVSRALVVLALLAVAMGCGDRTEVVVVVDTDLSAPDEVDRIRFAVDGPRGMQQTAAADPGATPLPVTLGLLHEGGPLEPLSVVVVAERGGSEIVRREARTAFVRGRTVMLRLDLLASCEAVTCPDGQTCGPGGCASVEVDSASLPEWEGDPGRLDASRPAPTDGGGMDATVTDASGTDGGADADGAVLDAPSDAGVDPCADCDDGLPCTVDACESGTCTHTPDDTLCDDGIACTVDACESGTCTHVPDDTVCNDAVACTADSCDGIEGCQNVQDHSLCPVGELCDATASACVAAPTFTQIYAVFTAECSPCHTNAPFSGDLNYSTRELAYADMVGVDAICGTGNVRVIPYDARSSLLWRKVAAVDLCGNRMPNGRTGLPASDIDAIRDWINAGAADN